MLNGSTWEEETLARLEYATEQQRKAGQALAHWTEVRKALEKVLELDRGIRGIKGNGQHVFDPERLRKQSIRESLMDIAAANKGLLVVAEATQILLDAEVSSNRDHVRNLIYSALYHGKKYFKKERPGHYSLTPSVEVPLSLLNE